PLDERHVRVLERRLAGADAGEPCVAEGGDQLGRSVEAGGRLDGVGVGRVTSREPTLEDAYVALVTEP
ncbi:MAG: hypothetical protein HY511_07145, partial [Actinobacteria bacterium]|nr:hypothetical protein [Actinomycetota bacterium]